MPKREDKTARNPTHKGVKHLFEKLPRFFTQLGATGKIAKQHPFISAVIGTCLFGLVAWGIVALCATPEIGPAVGNRAPEFTLQTIDGDSVTLSDFRGKIVMLSFWGDLNYCPDEAFYIQAVRDKRPEDELSILTIDGWLNHAEGQQFVTEHALTFPLLLDSEGKFYTDYDIVYIPQHFFIDTKGIIKAVTLGPFQSQDEIEGMLDSIKNNRKIERTTPTISNVQASCITDTRAAITWVTDKPATSQIMICSPAGFARWTEPEEPLLTSHSVTLGDLCPNTTYDFRALSGYNFENPIASEHYSFTTLPDISPPVINSIYISDITESSATIEWVTNEPATSQVGYGITEDYSSAIAVGKDLTTSHSVRLTGLEADTSYYVEVNSKDASGNEATLRIFPVATSPALPIGREVGMYAPDFTLQTIDGQSITLSDFRGKIVMVNFWLSYCKPCIYEMPYIRAVFDKWPDEELVILAVNVRESIEAVQSFIDNQGLTFPVLLDSEGDVDAVYQPPWFPTTFFIDAEGIIREVKEEPFNSQEEIESILKSL